MTRVILLLLAGCQPTLKDRVGESPDDPTVLDAALVPSDTIATVATLRWSTDVPTRSRVRYGTTQRTFETPPPVDARTDHDALLLGLPASTDVTWEVLDEDGTVLAGDTWRTGPLPTALPSLEVTGAGHDQFMFAPVIGATTAAVVLSPEGEIVWWHLDTSGLDVYRVRPSRDGTGIWYNAASVSGDPADDSRLVHVSWDGASVTELPVPLLAHDFVEADDGALHAIQVRYGGPAGPDDGDTLRGDALVAVTPNDGGVTELWNSWDCFDPAADTSDDPELGWTFANALDVADGGWVLGLRNFSSLVWIGADGGCDRVLGGALSDYTVDGARFLHQHQFHTFRGDDGADHVLVFDNEGAGGTKSRVVEYALGADTATEVWSYTPSPSIYSFVLGDVQRLDDGDTFVAWSVAGQLDRVTPDGVPAWSVNTGVGYAFGFVTLAPEIRP
ncbi:MAG: aryl-sulfate sulfotransferase [Myxococcota bacterium]